MKGTFRIRSTGFAGNAKVSIIATFKRASFLDYVYFTQLETSDPVTYGYPNPSPKLEGAYAQCTLTREQGRYLQAIPNSNPAKLLRRDLLRRQDAINGPMHTNDAFAICESPTLGRNSLDPIEVSATAPGWFSSKNSHPAPAASSSNPDFKGTYTTKSPVLTPPATNGELKNIAEPAFRFNGQVRICLSGTLDRR